MKWLTWNSTSHSYWNCFLSCGTTVLHKYLLSNLESVSVPSKQLFVSNTYAGGSQLVCRVCSTQGCRELGVQPALHFGGREFHSMTSSWLFNRGTTFSQTVTDKFLFATFSKMRTFQFWSRCRLNDQDRAKIGSLIQTPGSALSYSSHGFSVADVQAASNPA